jgi:hypothetical protein
MKKTVTKIILISITIFTTPFVDFGQKKINNSLTFIQGDSVHILNSGTTSITLERKPFSIRYFNKRYDSKRNHFYANQVAVLENPNDTLNLKVGQNTANTSYFQPGTGMAPGTNIMYDTIVVTNTGHHHLTYENQNDKRVYLISKNKNILELEWKISAINYHEKDVQFADLKLSILYFVCFNDGNLNDVIDFGEMKIITVKFK